MKNHWRLFHGAHEIQPQYCESAMMNDVDELAINLIKVKVLFNANIVAIRCSVLLINVNDKRGATGR